MMDRIPLHARVALIDGADSVYAMALSGTEGWIRDQKTDDDGFELVKIEWDKDHWRYNGQPDGWTFEAHFKMIGPPEPPKDSSEEEPEEIEIRLSPSPSEEMVEEYVDALSSAFDAASEAEGFITLVIRRVVNPQNPNEVMYIPQLYSHATTKEASLLLDIQLAEAAANSYEEMVLALIERLKRDAP